MALSYLAAGCVNCLTIVGIPFGLQAFKMAKLSLLPFGARVLDSPHRASGKMNGGRGHKQNGCTRPSATEI